MRPRRHSDRTARKDDGSVMVEYAFAFPILMLVVVFGLGALWAAFLEVLAGQAAREGARYASVAMAPTYHAYPDANGVLAHIEQRVPAKLLNLSTANITISYPGCPSPCATPPSNTPVVVTVSKSLPGLFHGITISATSAGEVRAE
jgi:Flp pilus assembly protein TadG